MFLDCCNFIFFILTFNHIQTHTEGLIIMDQKINNFQMHIHTLFFTSIYSKPMVEKKGLSISLFFSKYSSFKKTAIWMFYTVCPPRREQSQLYLYLCVCIDSHCGSQLLNLAWKRTTQTASDFKASS